MNQVSTIVIERLLDLKGRNALVTGAGSGIGQASALALAKAGAHVVAIDLTADDLKETAGASAGLRGSVTPLPLDVSDAAAVEQALWGRAFDVVLNAAGIQAQDVARNELGRVESGAGRQLNGLLQRTANGRASDA